MEFEYECPFCQKISKFQMNEEDYKMTQRDKATLVRCRCPNCNTTWESLWGLMKYGVITDGKL